MAAKISTFFIIALSGGAAGVFLLFVLVLGLNGFSERDAKWGIYLFVAGAVVTAIGTGAAGIFMMKYLLEKKNWNAVLSVVAASLTFVGVGIVIDVVLMFAGIFLADAVRNSHLR